MSTLNPDQIRKVLTDALGTHAPKIDPLVMHYFVGKQFLQQCVYPSGILDKFDDGEDEVVDALAPFLTDVKIPEEDQKQICNQVFQKLAGSNVRFLPVFGLSGFLTFIYVFF